MGGKSSAPAPDPRIGEASNRQVALNERMYDDYNKNDRPWMREVANRALAISEANAKRVMAANAEKTGPNAPKPGEGPSKEQREKGLFNLLYVAIAPDGRMVRAGVTGDRGDLGTIEQPLHGFAVGLAGRHFLLKRGIDGRLRRGVGILGTNRRSGGDKRQHESGE